MLTVQVAEQRLIQAMRDSLGNGFGLDLSKISHKETLGGNNFEFFVGKRVMLCAMDSDGKRIEVWEQNPKDADKEHPDDDSSCIGFFPLKLTAGTAEVLV